MRKASGLKILLCLAISFMVVLSLCVLGVLSGQNAYAMGGGGGKNKANLAKAQTLSVPSASDTVAGADPVSVPEPSTLIFLGAGAAGVAFAAYRKRFKK